MAENFVISRDRMDIMAKTLMDSPYHDSLYVVVYEIPVIDAKTHQAGPYTWEEAQYHLHDIAGYVGVRNPRVQIANETHKP